MFCRSSAGNVRAPARSVPCRGAIPQRQAQPVYCTKTLR
jgi:hypothetical protein